MLKGCVHYIFATLFLISKREHLWNKEEPFLFHIESSLHSWNNQILTFFRYSNVMTTSNAQAWNTKHILLNNLGNKQSLVMKFSQFMLYYKIKFLIKKLWEMWSGNWFQALFNFQNIICKKESEEVRMLIWTNFDSVAITYLI